MQRQNYNIQVLSAPAADRSGTTIALCFENKRYLFGHVGEATQRSVQQRGLAIRKLSHIFLTGSTSWKNNGGLLGLMLTLADVQAAERDPKDPEKRRELNIHGSPKLLHTLAAARRFIFRTGMPLTIRESTGEAFEWPSEPTFVDENIRVWSIPVRDADAVTEDSSNAEAADIVRQQQSTRREVVRNMFDSEWRRDRLIEDSFKNVKLPAMVFVRDQTTKELKGYHCPNHESAPQIHPDQRVFVRNPWPSSLVPNLPPATNLPSRISMSYIVRGHLQRGKFDPKKAIALGVKPGPLFSQLTVGKAVQLDNGTNVNPEEVMGEPRVSKGVAFFELPSPGHLKHLHQILTESDSGILADIAVAVWILGPGVAAREQFRHLLSVFDRLQHLVSDEDSAPNSLTFESSSLAISRLAKISPANFSVPVHGDEVYGREERSDQSLYSNKSVIPVEPGLKVTLEPTHTTIRDEIPELDLAKLETLELPETMVKTQIAPLASAFPPGSELTEPEIITLGTGSSSPSKYRNVSGTLIRLPHNQGNFLLDAGEGTLGQLRRSFPAKECDEVLRNLQGIWISHLHADHHLGLLSIIQARTAAFDALGLEGQNTDRTVFLMSERNVLDFVHEYSSVEPSVLSSSGLVPLECTPFDGSMLHSQPFDVAASKSALQHVQTARVAHCAGAQAVTLTFKSGFKISFSGDCRPSSQFCRIGLNSDVLIHEATFDDDMMGDALAKKHSTTAEALGVALKMKAKNVILTHFSQRYEKLPNLNSVKAPEEIQFEEGSASQENGPIEDNEPPAAVVPSSENASGGDQTSSTECAPARPGFVTSTLPIAIAFDLMRIKVSEIAGVKQYYPAIEEMFALHAAASQERRDEKSKELEQRAQSKRSATKKAVYPNGGVNKRSRRRGSLGFDARGLASDAANGEHAHPSPSSLSEDDNAETTMQEKHHKHSR